MKLVPATKEDIGRARAKRGKNIEVIKAFLEMDAGIVEVKDHGCRNVNSAYTSLANTLRRKDFGVTVVRRKNKIFMVKGDINELFI